MFKRWEPVKLRFVSFLLLFVPACLSLLLVPHLGVLGGVASCFLVYFAALSSSIVLYRISPLHPLYRYPGPLPAKITKWWHIWRVHKGKQHLYIQSLHDKYGDIVRIGECARFSAPLLSHNMPRSQRR